MRLGGPAAYLCEVKNQQELEQAITWAEAKNLPIIMIGVGSNIIWTDEGYKGLVIVDKIMGYEKFQEDEENVYLKIAGGENWDSVVARTVRDGLTGIEALSLIPGTAGATPVQNVGAYGQQISDTLVSVECYDRKEKQVVIIPNVECGFSYRNSRFKSSEKGRFFITAITLHLRHDNPKPPFYASLQTYFNNNSISSFTPQVLRDAVVAIRRAKLPDPEKVANNGSFFTNPVISDDQLNDLIFRYPSINYWHLGNGNTKIAAAWLVEQAGFKDAHDEETGMATWPAQSLVFVNEHAKTTEDLLKFRQKVTDAVKQKFDITLDQEPEIISS